MRVWISVHGRFHAFDLAREIARHGVLAGVATTYPSVIARRYLPRPVILRTAPWLEVFRRAAARTSARPDHLIASMFGRFAAKNFDRSANIFVGWSGASLEAIEPARQSGLKVIIERGSTHIQHQDTVLSLARQQIGIEGPAVDPRMIDRELQEYAAADAIAVPSRFAASTFHRFGISSDRLIVNPYGADLIRFTPRSRPEGGGPPRILFVGTLGVRKGLVGLLQAFERLKNKAELHLVGPIESEIKEWLRTHVSSSVVICGPLRSPDLERAYVTADIFCLPSLEEGFPLSMLQAMAAGLPLVVTPETGAEDVITDGREGLIVPSSDSTALSRALERLVDDKRERESMALSARTCVMSGLSWQDYGNRSVAAYRSLCH